MIVPWSLQCGTVTLLPAAVQKMMQANALPQRQALLPHFASLAV